MISLFTHRAEVPSKVPKCKKAGMGFMKKICVLDKLHSGTCHGALGCEFSDIK